MNTIIDYIKMLIKVKEFNMSNYPYIKNYNIKNGKKVIKYFLKKSKNNPLIKQLIDEERIYIFNKEEISISALIKKDKKTKSNTIYYISISQNGYGISYNMETKEWYTYFGDNLNFEIDFYKIIKISFKRFKNLNNFLSKLNYNTIDDILNNPYNCIGNKINYDMK